jgi:hypothetical protein
MRKHSALRSSLLADRGVRPVATLAAQLASPLVAAFAGGFLGCLLTLELTAIGVMSSLASASDGSPARRFLDHTHSAMLVRSVLSGSVRRHFWRNDLGCFADQ